VYRHHIPHPELVSASAFAVVLAVVFVLAFLSVIPLQGNLLFDLNQA
jgi:hypothetical protein